MSLFRRLSLRSRLMIIGVSGVAVALLVGGVLLYATLSIAVLMNVDNGARATATEVAALVNDDSLPDPVPVTGAQLVQVLDAEHRVLAGSAGADRLTPLLRQPELDRALAGKALTVDGSRVGLNGGLRVVAVPAGTAAEPHYVIVAVQLVDVDRNRDVLRSVLLVVFPLLLLVLAAIAWRVIGWTLQPVEQLRAGAERISGSGGVTDRLPVPASADEIGALAVTLNRMLDRLASARVRQRDFVADAAHELRSPLASIRMQLDVAEHLGEPNTSAADLRLDVDRLTALVEDLLLLARADADTRAPTTPSAFDARKLLAEVAERYAQAKVPVELLAGTPVPVAADREELRRATTNLVDNAVRHARHRVKLSADLQQGSAVLSVVDDGPGIAPADRQVVFERFTRLDAARNRNDGGTGLGLPIVRELVRRAGGTVTLSDAAPGLRAQIQLPMAHQPSSG